MDIKILYIPVARMTFDISTATKYFNESKELLASITDHLIAPDALLSDSEDVKAFVKKYQHEATVVIFQNVTFTDGEFILNVINETSKPILYWGVREPSVGGRLSLNSLTGVMSTSNVLFNNNRPALSIIGNPSEAKLIASLKEKLSVLNIVYKLSNLKLGVIGDFPQGFFFSGSDPEALKKAFNVELKKYDLYDVFNKAMKITKESYQSEIAFAKENVIGLNEDDENVIKFAQFTTAIKEIITNDGLKSLAMRCWPDFFTELSAAPCGIFSQLTQQGYPTGCESDIHGSLSMYVLQELTNSAPYLGDVVHFNEDDNTIVLWHCGFAPYSLANPKTGALVGVHPNRQLGYAMDFGLRPGIVTLLRIGYGPDGYRFIITSGQALDAPNSFKGTSALIKLNTKVDDFIKQSLDEGFEPHFALIYGDEVAKLKQLAAYYKIKVVEC